MLIGLHLIIKNKDDKANAQKKKTRWEYLKYFNEII